MKDALTPTHEAAGATPRPKRVRDYPRSEVPPKPAPIGPGARKRKRKADWAPLWDKPLAEWSSAARMELVDFRAWLNPYDARRMRAAGKAKLAEIEAEHRRAQRIENLAREALEWTGVKRWKRLDVYEKHIAVYDSLVFDGTKSPYFADYLRVRATSNEAQHYQEVLNHARGRMFYACQEIMATTYGVLKLVAIVAAVEALDNPEQAPPDAVLQFVIRAVERIKKRGVRRLAKFRDTFGYRAVFSYTELYETTSDGNLVRRTNLPRLSDFIEDAAITPNKEAANDLTTQQDTEDSEHRRFRVEWLFDSTDGAILTAAIRFPKLLDAVRARALHGSDAVAARALGIQSKTIARRVQKALVRCRSHYVAASIIASLKELLAE